jgi:hypothetical protein
MAPHAEFASCERGVEPIREGNVLARIGDEDFSFGLMVRRVRGIRCHGSPSGSHVSNSIKPKSPSLGKRLTHLDGLEKYVVVDLRIGGVEWREELFVIMARGQQVAFMENQLLDVIEGRRTFRLLEQLGDMRFCQHRPVTDFVLVTLLLH